MKIRILAWTLQEAETESELSPEDKDTNCTVLLRQDSPHAKRSVCGVCRGNANVEASCHYQPCHIKIVIITLLHYTLHFPSPD